MNDFQGKWWIIDKPDDFHYGTLNFDDDNIFLNINGHFPDEKTKRGIRYVNLLHGKADDGTQITLLNCNFYSASYSSGGYSKSVYKAGIVFYNHHFFSEEDIKFNGLFLRFDFLEEWLELNPFEFEWDDPDAQKRFTLKYQNPETLKFNVENLTFYFKFNLEYSSKLHKFEDIGVFAQVDIDLQAWLNIESTLHLVKNLKNFFSLAMGQNISVQQFLANTKYNENEIPEKLIKKRFLKNITIYAPKFSQKGEEQYSQVRTNIPFEWIKTNIATTFEKWFKFVKKHAPLYELYFSTLYEYEMYPISEFLALAQGLETYLPKQQSLLVKLENILEMFDYLVPEITSDKKAFIKTISDNRRWYTHYTKSSDKVLQISELIPYTRKLRVLIVSIMLHEIGIPEEKIKENASNFPPL